LAAICVLLAALIVAACAPATQAQGLRPHEPFNPAKAQSLPASMLSIQSGGQSYSFTVELADTQAERDVGLMHRDKLAADHGMLFDFQREQPERFWMRNTFIPLDMIFIRANGTIAYIAENTVPHSERPIGPSEPVRAVLEVPGGTAKRLGIGRGDVVRHSIFGNGL
jgi:uncharacterized membrane protein (UPF0127 family)